VDEDELQRVSRAQRIVEQRDPMIAREERIAPVLNQLELDKNKILSYPTVKRLKQDAGRKIKR